MRSDAPVLVSVIIPAYKAEAFIARTIRSVLAQTHQNLEVIVVDDGSPDGQNQVVHDYQKQDARVSLLTQKNKGVSRARNHGFEASKGDYVAFLDADDVWLEDNLKLKLDKFFWGDYGLVHSNAQLVDEHDQQLPTIKSGKEGQLLDDLLLWEGDCVPAPSSILVKKEVIDAVGGFNERLSTTADLEFFIRVASKYAIGHVDQVSWWYRVHSNQMHSNIPLLEHDLLITYQLASEASFFKSRAFQKRCYSNMYLILGKCYIGDAKNLPKGIKYISKALWNRPSKIFKLR